MVCFHFFNIKVFAYAIMNEERLGGILPKSDLPFQLCSIQLIFFAILIFSKNEKIKKMAIMMVLILMVHLQRL